MAFRKTVNCRKTRIKSGRPVLCLIIFICPSDFLLYSGYIILYILGCDTSFVKIAWRKADFVVPIDSKGVETEGFEILHVLQFATDTFLHEWREVH